MILLYITNIEAIYEFLVEFSFEYTNKPITKYFVRLLLGLKYQNSTCQE
jgi:hypothetical protein